MIRACRAIIVIEAGIMPAGDQWSVGIWPRKGKIARRKQQGNLLSRWKEMGRSRQVAVIILAAALSSRYSAFVQYLRPQYVTLYSNLDQTELPVLQFLREQGISYRLDSLGTRSRFPDKADELRIEMAGKGMPFCPGPGFELLTRRASG